MSMSPNEKADEVGIFLMRRHGWFLRAMAKVPVKPAVGIEELCGMLS